MFRLFFLGLLTVTGLILILLAVWLVFVLVRWVKRLVAAGNHYVGQQREQWEQRQVEKNLPDFLVKGVRSMERIEGLSLGVSIHWQVLLSPLLREARQVVELGVEKPEQAEIARSFFIVTLGAMEDFVTLLANENKEILDGEEEQARQSLVVLQSDVAKYKEKLESKRRFDLQVMLEVLKQRFR